MRILLASNHEYPAFGDVGSGLNPKPMPSGSGGHIFDLLAKGLSELGQEVFYMLPKGTRSSLPVPVVLVSEPRQDIDIFHRATYQFDDVVDSMRTNGRPWLSTCHLDPAIRGYQRRPVTRDHVFVSRTMARSFLHPRYVLNGIDPSEYFYSETKEDYFVFMSSMDSAGEKGLDEALSLSEEIGFRLVVAGTARDRATVEAVCERCARSGARYVGDVRGAEKAELLAGATGLVLPTRVNEAFGLCIAEALMSGTPVICSDKGACPELVSSDVGFVCRGRADYIAAFSAVRRIDSKACRARALREYHYLRMAADYVREYQKELGAAEC